MKGGTVGPLEGIKVLDLSAMVSGPVAATILADQGAEVIKVEPKTGEQMRHNIIDGHELLLYS